MKSVSLIIGAICVILLLSGAISAINSFRATDITEEYDITTAAGVVTANITLVHELFGDNTISAEVTSNNSLDAPIAFSYTSSTQVLQVTGLEVSQTRRLTIVYGTDALWDYPGASIAARVWPLFLVIGVIGLVVAAVYNATRHGE